MKPLRCGLLRVCCRSLRVVAGRCRGTFYLASLAILFIHGQGSNVKVALLLTFGYNSSMKSYLSSYSAAFYWNIPYIQTVLGFEKNKDLPVYITVPDRKTGHIKGNHVVSTCTVDLPSGALVSKNGEVVASPELVFLQLASKLSVHRHILLGLQLCSHPPGNPTKALTTKRKLTTFLAKTSGHRGHRKSLRAVKYVQDGSASIMESLVYMLLTLPNYLGGFGLGGATFNQEIKLDKKGATRLRQERCLADLYYQSKRLAVEYDSFAFHNSPAEQGRDMMRSAILEKQGINVMHLSTIQLYNKDDFADFAHNLARRLGKRIQIRTGKFYQRNYLLRKLLPSIRADSGHANDDKIGST